MRISRALVIAALTMGGTLAFVNSSHAADGPTVAWTAPANNSTVTGKISLKATATPATSGTSTIVKWCLTINGEDTNNYNVASFVDTSGYERSAASSYYTSPGCWFNDGLDSRKLTLSYDTTKWENKAYTFVVKVTDSSGRESTAASWTLTTANVGPTVAWTAPANNSTVTGKISLKATATPATSGTSTIVKWCLTINGEDTNNYNVASFVDTSGYERSAASSYYTSPGCWFNDGLDSRKLTLSYDTTKWENKAYTFVVKVTDSTGRESSEAKWTVTTNNPGPTITGTSSAGNAETRPSVSLTAKRNGDTEVTKWCVNFAQDSKIEILPLFIDSRGNELDKDAYEYEDNCFVPESEVLKASFFLVTDAAKNGKYSFEFWAYDENNHISEKYKFDYNLQDPGLKISLPDTQTLYLPGDFPTIQVDQQGGYRSIEVVQWSIDGKTIPGSSTTLDASLSEVSPGVHTVSVKVIDSIGQSYSAVKSYTMKWAPVLKFIDVDGYYWWTPASPKIKVKAYLGSAAWKGSHVATITYKNSSGKTVKQTFTIKNGSGSVVLQTLSKTTSVKVSVGATTGTVGASAEATVELRKKPPAPVYTNISLGLPSLVIWPNSFNATVRVSGKGNYACTLTFQDYYIDFSVAAGSSKTVRVQPTLGINMAQRVAVSCRSSYSSGFASDWLVLSLQR